MTELEQEAAVEKYFNNILPIALPKTKTRKCNILPIALPKTKTREWEATPAPQH